jgi:sugar/nucleoside kinase (ribokinase family)
VSGKTCQFELIYNQNGLLQDVNYEFGVSELLNEHFESLPLSRLYYHVSCRTPLNPEPVLNRLVKHNRKFSLDFIASSIKRQIDQAGEWITRADCVFLNTKEFDIFSNVIDPAKMRRIVVTSAALPVRVFENGRLILEKSCPKVGFYDVTGAGDAFVGAFLANYLHGRTLSTTVEDSIKIAQMSLMGLGVWGLLPHDK